MGPWDLALLGVVTLQVAAIAYLPRPRWKALALSLPFPFTTIALSQGDFINTTHVLALPVLLIYYHSIRLMHTRMPIVPAIATGLILYIGSGKLLLFSIPITPVSFWLAIGGIGALAIALFLRQPPRHEPDHRTPLPIYLKLPTVVAVVALLLVLKESLQGFATFFPLVGVAGLYEARKALWGICRQAPIFVGGMCAMLAMVYVVQTSLGLAPALFAGWVVYLAVLWPVTRRLWGQEGQWPNQLET